MRIICVALVRTGILNNQTSKRVVDVISLSLAPDLDASIRVDVLLLLFHQR